MFVQWIETDGRLQGQIQQFSKTDTGTFNSGFTGTRVGDQLLLNIGRISATGFITASILTLIVPGENGRLTTLVFQPGSVSDYNDTVSTLEAELSAERAAAQARLSTERAAAEASATAAAQEAARLLPETKRQNCAAIGGQIDSKEWSCSSIVQGNPSGTFQGECDRSILSFNDNGTVSRSNLEFDNLFHPGCFPPADTVPRSIAN